MGGGGGITQRGLAEVRSLDAADDVVPTAGVIRVVHHHHTSLGTLDFGEKDEGRDTAAQVWSVAATSGEDGVTLFRVIKRLFCCLAVG